MSWFVASADNNSLMATSTLNAQIIHKPEIRTTIMKVSKITHLFISRRTSLTNLCVARVAIGLLSPLPALSS